MKDEGYDFVLCIILNIHSFDWADRTTENVYDLKVETGISHSFPEKLVLAIFEATL